MNISLCMIVKDEEKNIKRCIESVENVVNEIVVVDTGSNDNTVNIAEEMGARIFHYEWDNDFSKARNYALRKVNKKCDWIIFLDADEYFKKESTDKIIDYIKEAEKNNCEFLKVTIIDINTSENDVIDTFKNIRIFKNKKYIHYQGAIHEIVVSDRPKRIAEVDLMLYHTGYNNEIVLQKDKSKRNLDLLYRQLKSEPDNLNIKFYIGESLLLAQKYKEARIYFDEVIDKNDGNLLGKIVGIYQRAYFYKLHILCNISNNIDEVKSFYEKCIDKYSEFPDYYESFGKYCYERREYDLAVGCFEKCLQKISKYDSDIGSKSLMHKKKIENKLIDSLINNNKKNEAIDILTKCIEEDKYDLERLIVLMQLLKESELPEEQYNDLNGLYDYKIFKDKVLLLQISEKLNNYKLCDLIYENLSEKEKEVYSGNSNIKVENEKINIDIYSLVETGKKLSINNKDEAIKYFEEAYGLLKNHIEKKNNKYVYVPYISMLYHFKKYNEVNRLVHEAIDLYDDENIGMIDLYYYAGITEVELNKGREAIDSLSRYFDLIDRVNNNRLIINESQQCYSINLQQNAYYNLSKAYWIIDDKEMFVENIYKIDDLEYLKLRLLEIIDLFLDNKYYDELIKYYTDILKNMFKMKKDLFIKIIYSKKDSIPDYEKLKRKLDDYFSSNYISDEFEEYKYQVKQTIKELLDKEDILNAQLIIKEYEDIVPNDFEIKKLKTKLNLLKI